MKLKNFVAVLFVVTALFLPVVSQKAKAPAFKVDFQKFTLPNGLEVVFHIDRSDPVVAVSLTAHVGSAREKPGRTGFAHMFEHLLFLESENLGKGGLDAMSARIGGSGANGSTNRDRTNYLQTVPKDALEKMLWAEADKLGWFINTVSEDVLAKEKQVVKNEKRQSDNQPYGHTQYVIDKHLYPVDHPYNWQVIGSLDDLDNATLDDVKEFFRRWYVPNNVTLTVAGDFDPVQARKWVERYFAEIKRGETIETQKKRPGAVKQTVKLYHEDNFATLPELTMAWPGVEDYHPDSYAIDVLTSYLSTGKKSPLYKVLVEKMKVAPAPEMGTYNSELAGQIMVQVQAFDGKDLDEVSAGIQEAFAMFERDGISLTDLNRIKAGQETAFYNSLSSVLGKGVQLTQYNMFAGDPGFVSKDIANILAVTPADVKRVYDKYIKGKNFVATSFVPKGKVAVALDGSTKADVVEEQIVQGAEAEVDPSAQAKYERTPSTFDRTKEPPYGATPELKIPAIWEQKLQNGLRVYGIETNEVPLVNFEIVIDGGSQLDSLDKVGVANMMARMMTQGTQKKTPQELEEAIQQLGATISVSAGPEDVRVSVNTLARNYDATLALVEEILLEPRWDAAEFDRIKRTTISQIQQIAASPTGTASIQASLLLYGKEDIRGRNALGTMDSVNALTIEDLKAFYAKNISPSVGRMHVVGSLNKPKVVGSLDGLNTRWAAKAVTLPTFKLPARAAKPTIYFYDFPGAPQSVVRIFTPALTAVDKEYYAANVANYILGGGGFASRLTQELRETKGYTYGIASAFQGSKNVGAFGISSSVRSNVTLEALQLIKSIVTDYGKTFTDADLETTKSFLIKSNARAFETAGAKLDMLDDISSYNWKYDYVKEREALVRNMTIEQIRDLAAKHLDLNKMTILVVGDAKTQLPRLKDLGFGDPVVIKK